MTITRERAYARTQDHGCTCSILQIIQAGGEHRTGCPSRQFVKAGEVKPGMILELWGDRIDVTAPAQPHADGGRRVKIGGYSVFADQPIKLLGHFNP